MPFIAALIRRYCKNKFSYWLFSLRQRGFRRKETVVNLKTHPCGVPATAKIAEAY